MNRKSSHSLGLLTSVNESIRKNSAIETVGWKTRPNPPFQQWGLIAVFFFLSFSIFANTPPKVTVEENLTGKITFKVDMRDEVVSPTGVFIAGSFLSTIGLANWSFQPMCDLGTGIWQVSFCDIPAGTYQYKFVNGNSPAIWEFNSWGGPCTNPADNNNRWVTVTGGVDFEGPWCWGTCDMFCSGMGDPGGSDGTPPTITEPAPPNTTIECGMPLPIGNPLASDDDCDINCTDETDMPVDDNSGLNSCGLGDIIRTWTATDCAGNTTTTTQTITVQDTQNPTITGAVPPDVTVECGNVPTPSTLTATDDCDNGIASTGMPTDDLSGINSCGTGTIVRTWSVTDCAGNSTSVSQNITVEDMTDPTFTQAIPVDVTVECGNIPAPNSLSASDDCDSGVTTTGMPTDDNSGIGTCGTGTIIRTWEVSDCSGNMISGNQTITVEDTTNPSITSAVPADVTVECGNVPTAVSLNATDGCDSGVTTTGMPTDDNSGIGACGTGTIIRTWEVSDCEGNSVSESQTITVEDFTAPTIDSPVPPNTTIECNDPLPVASALNASDNCDSGVTTTGMPTDDLSGVGACGTGNVIRTWTVSDCANNMTSVSQTITIQDTSNPTINGVAPPNTTIECGDPLPPTSALNASDSCDPNVTTTGMPTDDLSGLNACGTGNVIRTWTVSDCANNMTSVSQTIEIQDNTPPTITGAPPNITVECGNIPAPTTLSASDLCDSGLSSTAMPIDDNSGINTCGTGTIIRAWSAMDCAGNQVTVTQNITVTDNTPPVIFGVPSNTTLECGNVPPGFPLTASDGCDNSVTSTGSPTDDLSGINACGTGQIVRTWSVTDCAGNTTSMSQIITLVDTQIPQFLNVPPPATIECTTNLPPGTTLAVADGCDLTLLNSDLPTDDFSGLNSCGTGQVLRVWTATDCAGNTATATQVFTLTDSTPPVIGNAPPNTTADCGNIPPGAPLTASDACDGNVAVTDPPTDDLSNLDGCGLGDMIRTWTVTDCSGNSAMVSQIITLEDNAAPNIDEAIPTNLTVECGNIPPGTTLLASDNCDGNLTETDAPTDDLSGLNSCGTGDLIRTWAVTDCAGNTTTATQTITIEDTTPPDLTIPADGNFNCNDIPTASANDASGTDNCSNVTITYDGETVVGNGCPYEIHRTWTATDDCGNSASATQILTIEDFDAPIFLDTPNDTIVCEGTLPQIADLTWEDACEGSGTVAGIEISDGNTNPEILTRTWTYSDNCGNVVEYIQTLTVTQSPTADAGEDQTICEGSDISISGTVMGGFSSVLWTTSGDGIFGDNTNENTTYSPGMNDIQNGSATLTFTAQINSGDCSEATDNLTLTIIQTPVANAGLDTFLTCNFPMINLDGSSSSSGNHEFEWVGNGFNSNEQNPEISASGTYILTVSDTTAGLNCSATDTVFVDENFVEPIADAGQNLTLTCDLDSVILDGNNSSTGANFEYEWAGNGINSANQNDQNPSVFESGIYILTVTDLTNGCAATDTTEVILDGDLPTADAGQNQTINCNNSTVTLNGGNSETGLGIDYQWFAPDGTPLGTDTLQTADVTGIYTFEVSNSNNGCTQTATVEVLSDLTPPISNAGSDATLTCENPSAILNGNNSSQGNDFEFEWIFNGMSVGNDTSVTASNTGLYILNILNNSNGCAAADTVEVFENMVSPTAEAGADLTLTCTQTSVTLDGSQSSSGSDFEYFWTGSGINPGDENLQDPTVGQSGIYYLNVTDLTNGCEATDSVSVTLDDDLPIAVAQNDTILTCAVLEVPLSGLGSSEGGEFEYEWTDENDIFVSNDLTTTISQSGIYTLSVFNNLTQCESEATVSISLDTIAPTADAGLDLVINCQNPTVEIGGNSGTGAQISYEWFDSNNMPLGQNSTLDVNSEGNFIIVVTNNENGCQASDSVFVTDEIEFPTADAGTDLVLDCQNNSLFLDGNGSSQGAEFEYDWTGPNFSSNELNPEISQTGEYILTVLNTDNFCESSDTVQVNADSNLPHADAGLDTILTCLTTEILLDGSNSDTGTDFEYEWTNSAGIPLGNDLTVLINEPDIFELTVTNTQNGCVGTDMISVQIDTLSPMANAGSDFELDCITTSTVLDGSQSSVGSEFEYLWTGTGLTGDLNSLSPTAEQSGIFTLTVTNILNGCTAEDFVQITQNQDVPNATTGANQTLTCVITSVILEGNASVPNATFTWSGPGIDASNQNLQNPTVTVPGTYFLTVNDSQTGCDSPPAEVTVFENTTPPNAEILPAENLDCNTDMVQLDGQNSTQGDTISYQWFFENQPIPNSDSDVWTADQIGEYILAVTNSINGCVGSQSIQVQGNFIEPTITLEPLFEIGCSNDEIQLDVDFTITGTSSIISWEGPNLMTGNQTPTVTDEGDYTFTVTDGANGCSATAMTTVTKKEGIESVEIFRADPTCFGLTDGQIQIENIVGGTPDFMFSLNNAPFESKSEFDNLSPGVYTILIQDSEGCEIEETVELSEPVELVLELGGDVEINLGESVTLLPNFNLPIDIFNWTNAESLDCSNCEKPVATPSQTTTYNLTIISDNGCEATDDVTIFVIREASVYVPNVFSPNGDGVNDRFTIFGNSQIENIQTLMIFDRWGSPMFEGENLTPNDTNEGWDGTFRGEKMNAGTYVFFTEILMSDGTVEVMKGEVILVR